MSLTTVEMTLSSRRPTSKEDADPVVASDTTLWPRLSKSKPYRVVPVDGCGRVLRVAAAAAGERVDGVCSPSR